MPRSWMIFSRCSCNVGLDIPQKHIAVSSKGRKKMPKVGVFSESRRLYSHMGITWHYYNDYNVYLPKHGVFP
jgi:hypothetical protein